MFPQRNGRAECRSDWKSCASGAAECALIRDLAIGPKKRELLTSLAEHLNVCASEVERAIAESPYQEITPDFPPRV